MNWHYLNLFLVTLLALPCASVAEIYKSVDKDGNVVYSDEPSQEQESELVELGPIDPPSTPTMIGQPRRDSLTGPDDGLNPEMREQLIREQQAAHGRRCKEARVALDVLHEGMPVYRVDDGVYRPAWSGDQYRGKREYLTDAMRDNAIDDELRKLAMNCKEPLDEDEQIEVGIKWRKAEHCAAARVDLEFLLRPDSRAANTSIEDAQRLVDQFCED